MENWVSKELDRAISVFLSQEIIYIKKGGGRSFNVEKSFNLEKKYKNKISFLGR